MDNAYDPTSKTQKRCNENSIVLLTQKDGDLEGILRTPDRKRGEFAVLNPSLVQEDDVGPNPMVYRVVREDGEGEYSTIDFEVLEEPSRLGGVSRILIKPEYEYEKRGCEDPRLTKIKNVYFITYVGFDGDNARVCLATTKDFAKKRKFGVVGPEIELERAAKIVNNPFFKKKFEDDYKTISEGSNKTGKQIFLWDKDAFIDYNMKTNYWELFHRVDPDIQIAKAKHLKDFKRIDFWEEQIRNIDDYTLIKREWIPGAEKIGIGSPFFRLGDKRVGLLHWVDKELNYYGSFFEISDEGKVESILTSPFLIPNDEDEFNPLDEKKNNCKKRVVFPTASLLNHRLWVYYGSGDNKIKYRTTDEHWVYRELNHPHNKIKN